MAASILPYELYTDAPGILFTKPEWEKANAAHPAGFDFGPLPEGWPKKIESLFVWDGKDLEANPEKFMRILNGDEIVEVDTALHVCIPGTKHHNDANIRIVLPQTLTPSV